jgi:hypothetical protein
MHSLIHRWAFVLIVCVIWRSGIAVGEPKPDLPADTVTVLFRGKTHSLSGKAASELREAALELLRTSCLENGRVSNDAEIQQRYERAKKRSQVMITFAKPVEVPKAGNNKTPVSVQSLMIPFSPDLDPETVYVMPGKPFRAFTEFTPDLCDTVRALLVKAGIYPADSK